jgi:hypothetical protein
MTPTAPGRSLLVPSLTDLLFCIIFLALSFWTGSGLLGDGDTGYHVRAGQYILDTLSVPRQDIFSFHAPPIPWTAHEWLSEVIMALAHRWAGLSGVVAFFALILAATMALLFAALRRGGANVLLAAAITVFACCTSQIHWLARPHVFSFLMMLAWHHLLESWHAGKTDRLYLLPLSMLLWVNLHGGFPAGFLLLGAYLAGCLFDWQGASPAQLPERRHQILQLLAAAGASLLACLANPTGYHILLFPFRLVSNRFIMDHVNEFLSPNFHDLLPFKYLLLLLIALVALSRRPVRPTDLILVLLFTGMSLYSARYIPLFALVCAPMFPRYWYWPEGERAARVADFFRRRSQVVGTCDAMATGGFWPAAALLAVAVSLGSGQRPHAFDARKKPVAAVEFLLREPVAGRMFNDDEFGDYLIYRAWPSYRVFFDGRSDMYGTERLREYLQVGNFEPGFEQVLERYQIGWIFYGTGAPLSRFLMRDPSWVLIYSDPVASIFVKDLPQYRRLIANYRRNALAPRTSPADP